MSTVKDHPVHPKTSIKADKPYSCANRPERSPGNGYYAPNRKFYEKGMFETTMVWIPYAMSTKCRNFYLWDTDPRCSGCTTPKDIDYKLEMEALAAE